MKIHSKDFRVREGDDVDLKKWPTMVDPVYKSKEQYQELLTDNGTRIVKFFLHLSKDEQRKRFLARTDEPEKNWKFSTADVEERKYWKD
jgi:polyphosphate kinase 2 (PPK2 family)